MISHLWQVLTTDSPRHCTECPLAGMAILRGKDRNWQKNFFHAGMILWWNFMTESNQVSCIMFMILSASRLRFLSHCSCLFGLEQMKNQTRILWCNFDFADVIWHLSNFREISFLYLCYLVLFWKNAFAFSKADIVLIYMACAILSILATFGIDEKQEKLCIWELFFSFKDFKYGISKDSPLRRKYCS